MSVPPLVQGAIDLVVKMVRPEQVCGLCVMATLFGAVWAATSFASHDDVAALRNRIDLSAQLNLAAEIRVQVRLRCVVPDKEPLTRTIDKLQKEYRDITGLLYPEGNC
jgi:hypothetical protein